MKKKSLSGMNCSIARTLDIVGEWWTLLVIRDAFLGVRRFEDFQRRLGVARNILTARLQRLVEDGILERRRYQEHPERFEYVLTERGRDLFPVITALREWGDRWVAGEAGPPVVVSHAACGHPVELQVVCPHCREAVSDVRDVRAAPGPGARDADRAAWNAAAAGRERAGHSP